MKRFLYITALVLFMVNILLSALLWMSFRERFYNRQHQELKTAQRIGISEEELQEATNVLLSYIKGKRADLNLTVHIDGQPFEMFNAREKEHMVDVRNLYQTAVTFRSGSAIFIAMMILVSLGSGDYLDLPLNRDLYLKALLFLTGIIAVTAIFALADFNRFWITFHELVFTNDLWLLNPATDRLIMMFPEAFFMALVYRFIFVFVLCLLFAYFVYYVLDWMVKYAPHRSLRA